MIKNKIAILVKKASFVVDKKSNSILAPYELTNAQYRILKMICLVDKPIRQIDIENEFFMTNPTVTGIIQNLEKKNLVRRIENPDDKRSKIIIPTEKTLSILDDLIEVGENLEKDVTKNLTEDERRELIRLLRKMLELD